MTDFEYKVARMFIGLMCAVMFFVWLFMQVTGTDPVPQGDPDLAPVVFVPALTTTTTAATEVVTVPVQAVTTSTPSTTSTTLLAGEWSCPGVIATALLVGWPTDELARLDAVVWRESRCIPTVTNLQGRDRSYGLMQINTKGSLWPHRSELCNLRTPDDLLDPATNLTCGLALHARSGWAPWGF